jgi:hypothetical protein
MKSSIENLCDRETALFVLSLLPFPSSPLAVSILLLFRLEVLYMIFFFNWKRGSSKGGRFSSPKIASCEHDFGFAQFKLSILNSI